MSSQTLSNRHNNITPLRNHRLHHHSHPLVSNQHRQTTNNNNNHFRPQATNPPPPGHHNSHPFLPARNRNNHQLQMQINRWSPEARPHRIMEAISCRTIRQQYRHPHRPHHSRVQQQSHQLSDQHVLWAQIKCRFPSWWTPASLSLKPNQPIQMNCSQYRQTRFWPPQRNRFLWFLLNYRKI